MVNSIRFKEQSLEGHLVFDEQFRTILLSVAYPAEKVVELKGIISKHNLVVKPEHHVTLIGYNTGYLILEKEKLNPNIWATIKSVTENHNWSPILTNTFRILEQDFPEQEKKGTKVPSHKRKSLIQDISLEGFSEFYEELKKITETDTLNVPFPHITIASWSDYEPYTTRGIGLYSKDEVEMYTTQVGSIGELDNVKKKIKFTALFVKNIEDLLKRFPPKHKKVFGHHSTIEFGSNSLDGIEVGKEYSIKIIGRACDEFGDDLLVENPKSKNKYPHITLSRGENAPPLYAKILFDKALASNKIEYFDSEEVEVIEGFSDGENYILKQE